jgi:hypothetical protein
MWPWEHLAVGYLAYSVLLRLLTGRTPGDRDAVVLVVATQLPDLIDKPLAWWLAVLPSGLSLAHSLVFGVPVCLFVVALARRLGDLRVGLAYCVGYGSHLVGDAVYPLLTGGHLRLAFLAWPFVDRPPATAPGLLAQVLYFLGEFRAFLGTPRGRLYALFEIGVLAVALAVWVTDGYPGLSDPRHLDREKTRRADGDRR